MKKLLTFFTVLFLVIGYLQPAASAPKDTVVIAQGVDPSTLDPQNHYETPAFNILLNIYETLLVRNDEMKLEPLLATSWRLVNDLTWEFKLRKNVKFQNGEDFNAYVVKFSLERMNNPKNKLKQTTLQGIIEKIEIIDDYTIRIITRKPYPYLDAQLSHIGAMIPPKYLQEKGAVFFGANPVGTGPYKFVRWIKDDQLVLTANENYWGGKPKIKNVIFRPIPEATTRVAGLQTQELDVIVNIPPHLARLMDWSGDEKLLPGIELLFAPGHTIGLQAVAVNTAKGIAIVASDCAHIARSFKDDNPSCLITDLPAWLQSFDKLRAKAASLDLIFPGHDVLMFQNFPKVAEDVTRLV